jgi:hypothetical protein
MYNKLIMLLTSVGLSVLITSSSKYKGMYSLEVIYCSHISFNLESKRVNSWGYQLYYQLLFCLNAGSIRAQIAILTNHRP